jgi:hypothetical protein
LPLLTQLLNEARRKRNEEIQARLNRGEISIVQMHPMFCLLVGLLLLCLAVAIVAAIITPPPAIRSIPFPEKQLLT